MTQFFQFDTLTWPEIAALPRDLPLILPIGADLPLDGLPAILGFPEAAGILPALPYGWRGSGLEVSHTLFAALANNLLAGMREDGFTNLLVLAPPGMDISDAYQDVLNLPQSGSTYPANYLPLDGNQDKVVLIPVGHTEQHAYHLPLNTDTLIIEAIARGTVAARPDEAISLPVMPYGVSTHRAHFAGTFNCGGRAFEDFYLGVIDTLVMHGYTKFYLLSGHGGNVSFMVNIVKYAGERHPGIFCATSWLYLSGPEGIKSLEEHRQSGIGGMGHACELETSLILHLRPDLVHIDRAVDEIDFIATPSYYMDWVEGGALVANPPWSDDTATGAYGAGTLGTAEKGRLWLEAAITEKAGHVLEVIEQHERRAAKRITNQRISQGARETRTEA